MEDIVAGLSALAEPQSKVGIDTLNPDSVIAEVLRAFLGQIDKKSLRLWDWDAGRR